MNKPLVSVIVPVYNVEKYLRECMDSILGQSYGEIEVICVDDGSTDHSASILKSYALSDSRVRVLTKENEGMGGAAARNLGLKYAEGEYISILDSDDFFDRDMIKKAVLRAEETSADIVVFGGYEYDDRTGAFWDSRGILDMDQVPDLRVFSRDDCTDSVLQISSGMAWNKLFRRTFLNKYDLGFQNIRYSDDAYFTFSYMSLAERISVIDERLIYYRVNSGRNQTNGIADYPDSSYLPYLKLSESFKKWGIYNSIERSFLNCAAAFMKYCYEKINRYDAFLYLHTKFRNEIFDKLSLKGRDEGFYFDHRLTMWIRQVSEYEAGEILFLSARAHGDADSTTGVLRFCFPFERIPVNSRILIIGDRIVGRNYMSQAVLSGKYDVVGWVDKDNPRRFMSVEGYERLNRLDYDYALVSYTDKKRIDEVVIYLRELGMPDERILT